MIEKIKRPFKKDVYFECKWFTRKAFEKVAKERNLKFEEVI
jgi:hypothetical protein